MGVTVNHAQLVAKSGAKLNPQSTILLHLKCGSVLMPTRRLSPMLEISTIPSARTKCASTSRSPCRPCPGRRSIDSGTTGLLSPDSTKLLHVVLHVLMSLPQPAISLGLSYALERRISTLPHCMRMSLLPCDMSLRVTAILSCSLWPVQCSQCQLRTFRMIKT